jgi:hypothetical protein
MVSLLRLGGKPHVLVPVLVVACLTHTSAEAQRFARNVAVPPPRQDNVGACARSADEPHLSLHVEVLGASGQPGPGQNVQVSSMNGFPLVALNCDGPWANFMLEPGRYKVMAFLGPLRSNEIEVDVPPSGTAVTLTLDPAPNSQVAETLGVPRIEIAEDVITTLPPPPAELFQETPASAQAAELTSLPPAAAW